MSRLKLIRIITATAAIASSLLFGTVLDVDPAAAQTACGDRDEILTQLKQAHMETPRALGLASDGTVLEVAVSSAGTWTILVTYPDSRTCLVAAGEYWQSMPAVAAGPSA